MSKSEAFPDDGAASKVTFDFVGSIPTASCDLDCSTGDPEDGEVGIGIARVAHDGEAHGVVGGAHEGAAGERDGWGGRGRAAVPGRER